MGGIKAWLLAGVTAAAWAAPSQAQTQDARNLPSFSLGRDSVGQACRAQRVFGDPLARDRRDRAFDIYCGADVQGGASATPIGRAYLFAAGGEQALAGWRTTAQESCAAPRAQAWAPTNAQALESRLCQGETSGEFTGIAGRVANLQLAAQANGRIAAGDVIPVAAPALERAVSVLLGLEAPPPADAAQGPSSALQQQLQAALGGNLGGGGFADFYSLRQLAYENNALWLFAAAEQQFADAVRTHASLWPQDFSGRADLQAERALNLSNQRRTAEARRAFAEARSSAERAKDLLMIAKIQSYEGTAAVNEGDFTRALASLAEARKTLAARRAAAGGKIVSATSAGLASEDVRAALLEAQTWRAESAALRALDPAKSVAAAQTARARLSGIDPVYTAALRIGLAQDEAASLRAANRLDDAAKALADGLALAQAAGQRTRAEANIGIELGALKVARGDAAGALDDYRKAFAILRDQPENRGASPDRAMPYLQLLAERMAAQPNDAQTAEEIFAAFESLVSPAVAQTAAAAAARSLAGPSGSLIRRFQDADRALRQALARQAALPSDANAQARKDAAVAVDAVRIARESLARRVAADFPTYGIIALEQSSLGEVQNALAGNERLLRIALGAQSGVGLLIDKTSVRAFPIKAGEREVTALISRLKEEIELQESVSPSERADDISRQLFDRLFGAARSELLRADAPRRLLVETSGALATLPLGVLLTGPNATGQPRPYFGRRFTLLNPPGMRALVAGRAARPAQPSAPFKGFGDFVAAGSAGALTTREMAQRIIENRKLSSTCLATIDAALQALEPLPATERELKTAAQIMEAAASAITTREKFTTEAVSAAEAIGGARVVMFSTHGVFASDFSARNDALACLPDVGLLTSASPDAKDAFLDLTDILRLNLSATETVILSACDTGNPGSVDPTKTGLVSGGDALSGLARGFLYAGAKSVMVTHWKIPDEATSELMRRFFTAYKEGLPAPEAMQKAQLSLADDPQLDFSNQRFWAAFAIIGAPMAAAPGA